MKGSSKHCLPECVVGKVACAVDTWLQMPACQACGMSSALSATAKGMLSSWYQMSAKKTRQQSGRVCHKLLRQAVRLLMHAMPIARASPCRKGPSNSLTASTERKQPRSPHSEGQQLDLASVVSSRPQLQPEVLHLAMVLRKLRHWVHASPKLLVFVKEAVIIQHCMRSRGTSGGSFGGEERASAAGQSL